MIITITGKPCSGKSTVAKMFAEKYNFTHMSTGDLFRKYAKQFGYDILTFQQVDDRVKEIDELVDSKIINIGKTKSNENIIIDSRLAWHFMPASLKIKLEVDKEEAAKRIFNDISTN